MNDCYLATQYKKKLMDYQHPGSIFLEYLVAFDTQIAPEKGQPIAFCPWAA